MREYTISLQTNEAERYSSMVIKNRATGEEVAEYRLTPGLEYREIASMRRTIDRHLRHPGATLDNYQW